MMLPRRGCAIWSRTTPSITLSPKPLWREFSKAASRFGPCVPFVPAAQEAWLSAAGGLDEQRLPLTASAGRVVTAAGHRKRR